MFANGAVTAAFARAFGEAARVASEAQHGANAGISYKQLKALAAKVRGSFDAAHDMASEALGSYCASQGGCEPGVSEAHFEGTEFSWSKRLFFAKESEKSVGLTGAYVDRAGSAPRVVMFAGGIALQGNGTGPSALAEVLLHEFRHTTPGGSILSQQYWNSRQPLPYLQRPHETDAFRFSREVMDHAR